MKELLAKIFGFFKANNVELTPEQQAEIIEGVTKAGTTSLPPEIKLPEVSHNADAFNKVIQQMNAQAEAQQKKFEEIIAAQNKQNEDLIKMLGEERTQREQGMKALEDKAKAEKQAKIDEWIGKMKGDDMRIIPPQNKDIEDKYRKAFETDFDNTVALIEAMPKTPTTTPKPPIQGQESGKTYEPSPLASILTPSSQKQFENIPLVKQMN